MPIDPSISLSAKAPSLDASLAPLSSIMQLGLQSQALKKAKATYNADVSQRQAESSLANTQANVAQQIAPETVAQQQTATKSAQSSLQDQQMKIALRTLSGLYQDPDIQNPTNPAVVHQKLKDAQALAIQSGADPKLTAPFFDKIHASVDANPGQIKQLVLNSMLQGIDAAGQQGAVQPHYINTGGTLEQTNPAGVGPQAVTNTLSPGGQDALATDPNTGGTVVVHRAPTGGITGAREVGAPSNGQPPNQGTQTPAPNIGAPNSSPSSISLNFPRGETAQTQAALQSDRQATNQAAAGVPAQMDNIKQVISVLDRPGAVSKTGIGANVLAKLSGTVASPLSGDYATDFNTINHALTSQSVNAAKAMGLSTNAGQERSATATGSSDQDEKSLRVAVGTNAALLGGLRDFNNGQEAAIKQGGIFALRQFKNDWANNFDVDLYRLHTAAQLGDNKTLKEVSARLGPDRIKALGKNWEKLQTLANTGSLPNGQ